MPRQDHVIPVNRASSGRADGPIIAFVKSIDAQVHIREGSGESTHRYMQRSVVAGSFCWRISSV